MDFPHLLETYSAIKSVPAVEALPLIAMTIAKPYKNPPKQIFRNTSSKIGLKVATRKIKLAKNTCMSEKTTNFLPIYRKQNIATGILSAIIPRDVEKWIPNSEVIRSIRTATPVKPLDKICAGVKNTCIVNACKNADNNTVQKETIYRHIDLFSSFLIHGYFQFFYQVFINNIVTSFMRCRCKGIAHLCPCRRGIDLPVFTG